jgi:hypothetical protein
MGLCSQELRLVPGHLWPSPALTLVLWKELWKRRKSHFHLIFSRVPSLFGAFWQLQKKSAIAQITGVDISLFWIRIAHVDGRKA